MTDTRTPERIEAALVSRLEESVLLKPRKVAETLAVSLRTVYRLIDTGKLPHTRVAGEMRVPQSAVLAYIKANTYGAQ